MSKAFLLLGSNKGDRLEFINKAIVLLHEKAGKLITKSKIYETEPWGFSDSANFLNQVLIIETVLNPSKLLTEILTIELKLGRERNQTQYTSRTIDIDILFYENKIINENNLIIPHPRLHLRSFTLIPLLEIAPTFIHPLLKKDIRTLIKECEDNAKVIPYSIPSDL